MKNKILFLLLSIFLCGCSYKEQVLEIDKGNSEFKQMGKAMDNVDNTLSCLIKEDIAYSFPFSKDVVRTEIFLNTELNKSVILDVDMNTDVDDVCAVRMATTLDDLGIIDLKAVCYCVDNSNISALRGLLHHDGKDDVLIGQGTEQRDDDSPYWDVLRQYDDNNEDLDTAVRQYRKVLSNSDRAVDIVVTGHLTNLEALLKSESDDISSLSGKELILSKVGQLYVVGGENPKGWSNNLALTTEDIIVTQYVSENWELPIVFSPSQTGGQLVCGKYLQDLDVDRLDPVTQCLYAFGTSTGRAAWDPFGVWICGYACGHVNQVNLTKVDFSISDTGVNKFISNDDGKDYLVTLSNNDLNYYNQIMDNHLIYMFTKNYGIENPNKEEIGIHK